MATHTSSTARAFWHAGWTFGLFCVHGDWPIRKSYRNGCATIPNKHSVRVCNDSSRMSKMRSKKTQNIMPARGPQTVVMHWQKRRTLRVGDGAESRGPESNATRNEPKIREQSTTEHRAEQQSTPASRAEQSSRSKRSKEVHRSKRRTAAKMPPTATGPKRVTENASKKPKC